MEVQFLLVLCFQSLHAFLPNNLEACANRLEGTRMDFTHANMIQLSSSKALEATSNQDSSSLAYYEALRSIVDGSDTLDHVGFRKAIHHFNAELIKEGNERLIELKSQINSHIASDSAHRLDVVRHLVGQSLHMIQDFYSNTDWVEMHKNISNEYSFYNDLGRADAVILHATKKPACIEDAPNTPHGNQGNLAHDKSWITSGYRSDQDVDKPRENTRTSFGLALGKCSHGGIFDDSSLLAPTGGINSESYNYSLSPKFYQHESSAKSAIAASIDFLKNVPKLPDVLGLSSPQHVLLIVTKELQEILSSDMKPGTFLHQQRVLPWSVVHLVTASTSIQIDSKLLTADTILRQSPVLVAQNSILKASLQLPEHSTLIIIAGDLSFGGWDEGVVKKVLLSRNIKLTVFYRFINDGHPIKDDVTKIRTLCLSTHGKFFLIENSDQLLDILFSYKPSLHEMHLKTNMRGEVLAPMIPYATSFLMINCLKKPLNMIAVEPMQGQVKIHLVLDTDYTFLYEIQSLDEPSLITSVLGPGQECLASVWSEARSPVTISPFVKGPRDQRFVNRFLVPYKGSGIIVGLSDSYSPFLKPKQITLGKETQLLKSCSYEKTENSELHFIAEDILQLKTDSVDVLGTFLGELLETRWYTSTQYVELSAYYLHSDSEPSTLKIANNLHSIYYSLSAIHADDIDIKVSHTEGFLASGEESEITLQVTAKTSFSSVLLRPVVILVSATELETNSTFLTSLSIMYQITKPAPHTSTQSTQRESTAQKQSNIAFPTYSDSSSLMEASRRTISVSDEESTTPLTATTVNLDLDNLEQITTPELTATPFSVSGSDEGFIFMFSQTFIGIVVSAVVLILIIAFILYYAYVRNRKAKNIKKPLTDIENNTILVTDL